MTAPGPSCRAGWLRQRTLRRQRARLELEVESGRQLGPACSRGTVRTRIFQGNHWLYQVDTPAGLVTVVRQNGGEAVPVEGEAVRLSWRGEDMVIGAFAQGGQ